MLGRVPRHRRWASVVALGLAARCLACGSFGATSAGVGSDGGTGSSEDAAGGAVPADASPDSSGCGRYPGAIVCDDCDDGKRSALWMDAPPGGPLTRIEAPGYSGAAALVATSIDGETAGPHLRISNQDLTDGGTPAVVRLDLVLRVDAPPPPGATVAVAAIGPNGLGNTSTALVLFLSAEGLDAQLVHPGDGGSGPEAVGHIALPEPGTWTARLGLELDYLDGSAAFWADTVRTGSRRLTEPLPPPTENTVGVGILFAGGTNGMSVTVRIDDVALSKR